MARRKKSVVLAKLAEDSRGELKSMVTELSGDREVGSDRAKTGHWSRRFGASGKALCAPVPMNMPLR
jgi:hypothetical protein